MENKHNYIFIDMSSCNNIGILNFKIIELVNGNVFRYNDTIVTDGNKTVCYSSSCSK